MHAHISHVAHHHPAKHSQRLAVQVNWIYLSVSQHGMQALPFTMFPFRYYSAPGLHGYMCNMIPHYLNVLASVTSMKTYQITLCLTITWAHQYVHQIVSNLSHTIICACAAILSALRNLQEKIRRLELERGRPELGLRTTGKDAPRTHLQSERVTQRRADTVREMSHESSNCNQGELVVKRYW